MYTLLAVCSRSHKHSLHTVCCVAYIYNTAAACKSSSRFTTNPLCLQDSHSRARVNGTSRRRRRRRSHSQQPTDANNKRARARNSDNVSLFVPEISCAISL